MYQYGAVYGERKDENGGYLFLLLLHSGFSSFPSLFLSSGTRRLLRQKERERRGGRREEGRSFYLPLSAK